MHKIVCLLSLFFFIACSDAPEKIVPQVEDKIKEETKIPNQESSKTTNQEKSAATIPENDVPTKLNSKIEIENLSPKEFANMILLDKYPPSDNRQTFQIMDSLQAKSKADRQFYFKVFLKIMEQSDGALSEVIGLYAYKFVEQYPQEFFENSKTMTKAQFTEWAEFIGYEIYVSSEVDPLEDAEVYCNKLKQHFTMPQQKPVQIFCAIIKRVITDQDK